MEGAGIFLFAVGKAKIPSRGREKSPSGDLFVTTKDTVETAAMFFVSKNREGWPASSTNVGEERLVGTYKS